MAKVEIDGLYSRAEGYNVAYGELALIYEKCLERSGGNAEVAGDVFFKEIKHKNANVLSNPIFRIQCDIIDVYYMLICGVAYQNKETIAEVIDECHQIKKSKALKALSKEDKQLMLKHIKYIFARWQVR